MDATWDDAGGGTTSTPDENVVDEVGGAVGISYSDTEPLNTSGKLEQREHDRWDLDPASVPEYQDRFKEEFHEPQAPNARARKRGLGENHNK
jgi:hypothetical protein